MSNARRAGLRKPVAAGLAAGVSAALLLATPYVAEAAPVPLPDAGNAPKASASPAAPAPTAGSAARPQSVVSTAVEKARAQAAKTGKDVPVPELTTEHTTTVATPKGKLRSDSHVLPQRRKGAKGRWQTLDDTLTVRADGTVAPKSAGSDLVISGGGNGPLATMTTPDGKKLSVSSPFPGALPKPVLRGNDAVFENVATDTDLQVTATKYGGYTTVVVLRTPAAAANPAVRNLVFPAETHGLTLNKGKDGGLTATAGKDTVFRAPAPLMWSAGEARTPGARGSRYADLDGASGLSSADGPGAGASVARIPVTGAQVTEVPVPGAAKTAGTKTAGTKTAGTKTAGTKTAGAKTAGAGTAGAEAAGAKAAHRRATGRIALAPSAALLDGAATKYPVYVDPSWSVDSRGKQHHAWVQQAYDAGNYDRTGSGDRDKPGVGYQGWETSKGIERALYEFDLSGYAGATVNYAKLRLEQYTSADWSCTNQYPVHLYRAGAFDSSVKWSNHQIREWIQNQNVGGNGNSNDCYPNIPVEFNVTNAMRDGIRTTGTPLAFALTGKEGTGDKIAFKRFAYTAVLSAEYDFPPLVPENTRTVPAPRRVVAGDTQACAEVPADQFGWITTPTVTLASKVGSPNQGQLTEYVRVWDHETGTEVNAGWSGFVATGTDAFYSTPLDALKDGRNYGWAVQGDDGLIRGPGSAPCHFAVDLTPPVLEFGPFTDPATQFPPAGHGQISRLRLGDTGSLPFVASDPSPGAGLRSSGLACIEWGFDPQLTGAQKQCGSPLAQSALGVKPTHWGTNIVYARVLDEAGNASPTKSYAFYVPWKDGAVAFGDTTGDARSDILLPDAAGNLVTHGRASDGTSRSMIPSGTAATALQAPEAAGGRTWKDYRTVHRGSLDPGRNVDDLFVHQEPATPGALGGAQLFAYDNTLSDPGRFTLGTKTTVDKPECSTAYTTACTGYRNEATWQYSSQITPTGPARTTRTPSRKVTDATGLLAVEAGNLWFYPVKTNQTLAAPTLVDAGGTWDDKDLMIPGNALNIGATTDTAPALWVRNRTSGDIFQYKLTTATRAADGYVVVTGAAAQPATRIGYGIKGADYPRVGSDGDVTGDDVPDFWAVGTDGTLHAWAGTAAGGAVTGYEGHHVRGDAQAPTVQWRLEGDTKAIPAKNGSGASNDATATAVTYATETVDGRPRKVAVFDPAAKSVVTGPANAVDTRQSFTISTWVRMNAPDGMIVSQDGAHASAFKLWADAGHWRFAIAHGDNDGWPYDHNSTVTSANAFKPGVWTQLTATYNATTGAMNLYVNGTLASSGHHRASTSPAPGGALVIGRYKYVSKPSNHLDGAVAGLSVYQNHVPPVTTTDLPVRYAASPDFCADAPGGANGNGNQLQLWDCNGGDSQKFSVNANGTLTQKGQCVAVRGNQTAAGTDLIFWQCLGEGGQQWLPRADGSLFNPQSNACFDLPQAKRDWGTKLMLWTCNGTPAQRWSIPTLMTPDLPVAP
ncbi:ricin-type beta-trefoil lectin domain protein [Streptomyces bambusae]|uniref:ricin-type beta-trefoil lectin domain protein n=1 Tax=Streptomyces bambusae TaxID=1550616 RepID=UPI001CFE8957|nr:ricin-type beta-trefoil lectin domain protein [Streptomyces bambusae]MCB5167668.1 ricin-type beta-trefoil lectin domain protein [Streptomyces bambusae]